MQVAQRNQFNSRISRIKAGGPNTFSTVYTGSQEMVGKKKVAGVQHNRVQHLETGVKQSKLLRQGLKIGVMRVVLLAVAILIWNVARSYL